MATRTNWHLDALVLPAGDPMAEIEQLKSDAELVDLTRPRAEVMADLTAAFEREARLSHYGGVECSIKGAARPPCYECPHHVADPSVNALGLICEIGRHQVDLLDELESITAAERLDDELAVAFQRDQAACEELAAAVV